MEIKYILMWIKRKDLLMGHDVAVNGNNGRYISYKSFFTYSLSLIVIVIMQNIVTRQ